MSDKFETHHTSWLDPEGTRPCPTRSTALTLSHVVLPIANPVSDAKVLTGRQKPLTETVLLFVEVTTEQGLTGMGFSYSKRAGGKAQFAHLKEVAEVAIGQDPSDIAKIYESLMWAGASVGRSGVATQAVAALDVALWDLKARRADLPLAKLLGSHRDSCRVYNTSGGFLQASLEEMKEKASASLEAGIAGIKIKVGQPDWRLDLRAGRGDARAPGRRCRSWSTPTSSGTVPAPAGCAASSSSTTWSGSRSPSTRGTPSVTPTCRASSTPRSRPARC